MCRVSPRPAPPSRRTQQERRDESARRLLQAAIELFAEHGYDATSAGAIAERAGYSRSLVNVRYGSKQALLEELLTTQLEDRLLAPPSDEVDGLTQMLQPIDRVIALLKEDAQLSRAFFVLMFEAIGPVPALRPHVASWFARLESATGTALEHGRRDGSVRADIDIAAEVLEFTHISTGVVYRWVMDPDGFDLDAALRAWRARLAGRLSP